MRLSGLAGLLFIVFVFDLTRATTAVAQETKNELILRAVSDTLNVAMTVLCERNKASSDYSCVFMSASLSEPQKIDVDKQIKKAQLMNEKQILEAMSFQESWQKVEGKDPVPSYSEPVARTRFRQMLNKYRQRMIGCKNEACLRKAYVALTKWSARRCLIAHSSFRMNIRKVSEKKWMGSNSVSATEILQIGDNQWEVKRIFPRPEGKVVDSYSTRNIQELAPKCSYLSFVH